MKKPAQPSGVLLFLQNQWFKDPEAVEALLARHEGDEPFRRDFIKRCLFMGCRTGKVIDDIFGDRLADITFEETSRRIGSHAASAFPADVAHMAAVIADVRPAVIIAMGNTARAAVKSLLAGGTMAEPLPDCSGAGEQSEGAPLCAHVLFAPHPTARHSYTLPAIRSVRRALDKLMPV